jgi:tetratricopeptide (TPR) repeat protein
VLFDSGDAMEQTTPYHAWRSILYRLLDLDGLSPDAARQRMRERLAHIDDLVPLAPLIDVVLPISQPDAESTPAVIRQVRAEATREALIWLLQEASTQTPCLLLFDDAHWLDPASWELVVAASERIHSLLLVLTMRPMNGSVVSSYLDLLRVPRVRQLELGSLSFDESITLICQRLGVAYVPDLLASLIYGQANGNPFFTQELIYALRDSGLIHVSEGTCEIASEDDLLRALRQSDTVQAVITSRLDRLSLAGQLTLKVASVIGQVFAVQTLQGVYPVETDAQALAADLAALQNLDLIQPDETATEPTYRFKQVITQEVVYNLIPFAQRRQLHRKVAEWYERTAADRLEDLAPLISQHFLKIDDDRALNYFLRAGDAALREHNYPEALRHYERAREFVNTQHIDTRATEQATVALEHLFVQRGRALELNGEGDAALKNYSALESIAQQRADLRLELAGLMARAALYTAPSATHDPLQARVIVSYALNLARRLGDGRAESRLLWHLMLLHIATRSNPREALHYGEQSLELARAFDLREQMALTLNDMSTAYWANGEPLHSMAALEEAQALWSELDNLPRLADTLARLALGSFLIGNYEQALEHSQAAYRLCASIGDRAGQANSRLVVGHIYLERGMYSTALERMQEAVDLAEQGEHLAVQVGTRADLGWVYGVLGHYRRGLELAQEASIRAQAQLPVLQPWARAVLVRLLLRDGQLGEAERAMQTSPPDLHHGAYTVLAPMLTLLAAGELALAQQNAVRALQATDELLTYLTHNGVSAFRAQTLYLKGQSLLALGRLAEASDALQAARAQAETLGAQHLLWPILFTLGQIYARSKNTKEANWLWKQARDILKGLTLTITDDSLRAAFLATANVATVLHSEHLTQSPNLFYSQIGGRHVVF